jgi:hypothetical protein
MLILSYGTNEFDRLKFFYVFNFGVVFFMYI